MYHTHFKCNKKRIVDFPNILGFARDLYQTPGVKETFNPEETKKHYYGVFDQNREGERGGGRGIVWREEALTHTHIHTHTHTHTFTSEVAPAASSASATSSGCCTAFQS